MSEVRTVYCCVGCEKPFSDEESAQDCCLPSEEYQCSVCDTVFTRFKDAAACLDECEGKVSEQEREEIARDLYKSELIFKGVPIGGEETFVSNYMERFG